MSSLAMLASTGLVIAVAFVLAVYAHAQEKAGDTGWSKPATVVTTHARLAVGNRVHMVGHEGTKLVHRSSADGGATWGDPTVIGEARTNFPMMYGGLYSSGDSVFLLTADGDMGPGVRHLDFRRSDDTGTTWSKPVRITDDATKVFRARIVVSGNTVHVGGQGEPKPEGAMVYFRSKDGGKTWDKPRVVAKDLGPYGGGQTVAADGKMVYLAYVKARNGVGGGDTYFIRSEDEGTTWSDPTLIGETTKESSRQARVQVVAAKGHVFLVWQREADKTGDPVPAMRLGYNTSADAGKTWDGAKVLPGEAVNRNHPQICMTEDGTVHLCWRQGEDGNADPMGYMRSTNFGRDWEKGGIAFSTGATNHPYSIEADGQAVHVVTGPLEAMVYSRLMLK